MPAEIAEFARAELQKAAEIAEATFSREAFDIAKMIRKLME
jgi:hypothetical protein